MIRLDIFLGMRSVILISFLSIFFSFNTKAQGLSSIDFNAIKISERDELIISLSPSFGFKNHTWSIGPTILYSFGDKLDDRSAIKFTGIQLGYRNYLNGKSSKLNMFYSLDLMTQRIKDEQTSQFFDLVSNSFLDNDIKQIDTDLLLILSSGVEWNVGNKLNLSQTIGVGVNAIFRNTESDIDSFKDTFLSQIWAIKTSISYRIGE